VSSCFLSVRFSLLSSCYCPGSRRASLSIGSRGVLCSSEWTCSSFGTVLGNRRVCGAFLARPCVGIRGSGGMDGVLLVVVIWWLRELWSSGGNRVGAW
jgi:hypothetical protein